MQWHKAHAHLWHFLRLGSHFGWTQTKEPSNLHRALSFKFLTIFAPLVTSCRCRCRCLQDSPWTCLGEWLRRLSGWSIRWSASSIILLSDLRHSLISRIMIDEHIGQVMDRNFIVASVLNVVPCRDAVVSKAGIYAPLVNRASLIKPSILPCFWSHLSRCIESCLYVWQVETLKYLSYDMISSLLSKIYLPLRHSAPVCWQLRPSPIPLNCTEFHNPSFYLAFSLYHTVSYLDTAIFFAVTVYCNLCN